LLWPAQAQSTVLPHDLQRAEDAEVEHSGADGSASIAIR
jgi:hypothetical protein